MLSIKSVNVYFSKKQVIKNASLNIDKGQIVGLVGPNGAGKTTIMKTILGLTKFDGQITIDDVEVSQFEHSALNRVGALIENPAVYPFLTGWQNLRLYSKNIENIKDVVLELKMSSYINNVSKSYSLGMRQKLGIAIALIDNPELVILDEPMNGLDTESTILLRNIIERESEKGTTFLISSHILGELEKLITDIVLVNNGSIILNKSFDEYQKNAITQYRVMTTKLDRTKKLLTHNKIIFTTNNDYLEINKNDLIQFRELMKLNEIDILELTPLKNDFEDLIISSLKGGKSIE